MNKELLKDMRLAIKKGDLALFEKYLKENKTMIDAKSIFGSFLHDSATYGEYKIAKFLIESGLDVNLRGGVNDCGAITTAAFRGHLDIVKLIFANGGELDVSNSNRNPLFAAIYNGHFEIVKFLVDNGIDLTAHYAIGQLDKVDACEYARQYGRTEIYNYLKEKMK